MAIVVKCDEETEDEAASWTLLKILSVVESLRCCQISSVF